MTIEDQQTAFFDYVEARARAEATMDFNDAYAAGQAWVRFLNTFLPIDRRMPARPVPGSNIIEFPKNYGAAQ